MSTYSLPIPTWPSYMSHLAKRRSRSYARSFPNRPGLVPVVIGEDLSAYAMARCLHQAYGSRISVIASEPVAALRHSRFLDCHLVADLGNDEVVLKALRAITEATGSATRVIVGSFDGLVDFLARHRDELSASYAFPTCDEEAVETLVDRAEFAQCCADLNIPAPYQQRINAGHEAPVSFDIPFPVVAAASVWRVREERRYGVKEPTRVLEGPQDARRFWRDLEGISFDGDVVIGPVIEAAATETTLLSLYVNSHGSVSVASSVRVLLGSADASAVRHEVAWLSERPDPALVQHAVAIVTKTGYRGFVTFTIRRDAGTGEHLFVEARPTGGMYSYSAMVGGVNPMRDLVADLVDGAKLPLRLTYEESIVTALPLTLLARQIPDPELRRRVSQLIRLGRVANPLAYAHDYSLRNAVSTHLYLGALIAAVRRGLPLTHHVSSR
ncbi:hypothetical protein H8R18_04515 [Nanchangia anserum]|uniref:ATP-grasp domain-containing protein n=1 Tax=Nanchangia anserum TaxID=2692125 RepID=A0A8I0GAS1_9ACTO|nr:hypothetical protein [Nanchangia anserum]MBD3688816.1 hypothetical protein [Nanchangia anserum]QOX81093.1 hypothetical protein H8R18_04515 [Nanchangia anserum]